MDPNVEKRVRLEQWFIAWTYSESIVDLVGFMF